MRGYTALLVLSAIGCGQAEPPPPWDKNLAATSALYPVRRGLRIARGTIHLHSVHSHDACDNKPMPGGMPAQPCFQQLRDALCATHQDYAMLTDHDDFMADAQWSDLFVPVAGDQPVMKNGVQIASQVVCADGSRVLLTAGGENDLMPVGMERHVSDDIQMRHDIMNGTDLASVAAMRAAGAALMIAHGESHPIEQFRELSPEATEVYNLHANLDPKIRTLMGLDPLSAIAGLTQFLPGKEDAPIPDLALLGFVEDNAFELSRVDTLLAEGKHITGTFGADSHQNVLPSPLTDGDRGDSHRRVLRWFANHLLVPEVTPDAIKAALVGGRAYGVFHLLGDPIDFDFRAEEGARVAEMGDQVPVGATLVIDPPRVPAGAEVTVRLLRVTSGGPVEVAAGDAITSLRYTATEAGAYRAEVHITPNHLTGYMGNRQAKLLHRFLWIFANAIYVR